MPALLDKAFQVNEFEDWYLSNVNVYARPDFTFSGVQIQTTIVDAGESQPIEGRFFGYNYPDEMHMKKAVLKENQVTGVKFWLSD
jgi:hypothetical protein